MALERLLAFDVVGLMAHFRKFYTNSSSLSYAIPPRTTLMGLIAALLARERDSYYGELGLERARIGVALRSPVRTVMQTVNYLLTKNEGWDGSRGHTQIPVEFVLPRPPERFVRYRVYFAHTDEALLEELHRRVEAGEYTYPLSLGLTECPAWVETPRLYGSHEILSVRDPAEPLPLGTAVPLPRLAGIPSLEGLEGRRLLKDRMPLDFHPDRRLKVACDILWEAEGQPLPLRVRGEVFRLRLPPEDDEDTASSWSFNMPSPENAPPPTKRYESHPGKPLVEHLREVAAGARARLDHPALRHRELLRQAAFLVGLAHDLGKYTTYFQEHLRKKKRFEGGLERHAFLGALLAAWLLHERLQDRDLPDAPNREFLPLLGYLAVHRHHGHLVAPETLLPPPGGMKRATGELYRALRALEKQREDLQRQKAFWGPEWRALGIEEATEFVEASAAEVEALFVELSRLEYNLKRLPEEEGARLGLWGQLLFSALIDADKFSAAALAQPKRYEIPLDRVEHHLQERYPVPVPRHELDQLRGAFHRAVRERVAALGPEEIPGRIFSLTAPTGLGKTLAALDASLRLRAKLQALWGGREAHAPRIVYALPFINIIEQNYQVFHDVLRPLGPDGEVPETLLLRHHHLAEIAYRWGSGSASGAGSGAEREELPLDRALMMIEAWESEIVVTTFVQLFQTVLGYQNRFLKKLHNLIGSIVILDEVQALPMEYWPLTARVFETLGRELGLVVLQMTATRPLIFPSQDVRELHPDPPALFRQQRRTRLHIEREELPLEAWVERVVGLCERHGSLLVVVNTVRAALEVYRRLRDQVNDAEPFGLRAPSAERWLVHLSTNLVPKQRRERIEELKEHLRPEQGGRALVVSTQVIEAGVDLDFPAVVRDLGPVDAIVQVAGRCNREGHLPRQGTVYVLPLKDGGCARVYGAVHPYVTRRLLEGIAQVDEPEYAELVERYFQETQGRLSQEASERLWRAYTRLAYDRLEDESLSEFHLIESSEQVPIFVALTSEDERWLLEEFQPAVLEERDLRKRREAYLRHRRRLHDHLVRPLLQRAAQNLPPALAGSESLRWVPHDQLHDFYDEETGFLWRPEELADAWMV
jgi:CRISPR-associated endonuclease/helicase Cas3